MCINNFAQKQNRKKSSQLSDVFCSKKSGFPNGLSHHFTFSAAATVQVNSYLNYYAYGMPKSPNGDYQGSAAAWFCKEIAPFRFGFNTQERSDEIAGFLNHNTAQFWEYDTRIAFRWNIDPIERIGISGYNCFNGNPILFNDINGDTPHDPVDNKSYNNGDLAQDFREWWQNSKTVAAIKGAVGKFAGGVKSLFNKSKKTTTSSSGGATSTVATQTSSEESDGTALFDDGGILPGQIEAKASPYKGNRSGMSAEPDPYPPTPKSTFPSILTIISNYPLPYSRRPDRTPIDSKKPLNDINGDNFLYFNQCAIRVSIALKKSGVDLTGATNITNPKAGSKGAYGNGNILGATNLAHFLRKQYLGKPEIYNGTTVDVKSLILNRQGILYFEGIIEDGIRSNRNVNIEVWDIDHYMSSFSFSQMFGATTIWFWPLN